MGIRDATADDHDLYVELFPDLGVDDPTPTHEAFAENLAPSSFVIEVDGQRAGFAFIAILDGVGYVRQMVVVPSFRRRGLGRALLKEAARRMRTAGCETWCLNVHPANTPAVELYRSVGMSRQHGSAAVRLPWDHLDRLPHDPAISTAEVAPAERSDLERRFGLLPGQLAQLHERRDVHQHWAKRDDEPVGVASFDPHFPGCFPFRATAATAARALVASFLPHRPDGSPWIQLVLEDAPDLAQTLTDAGATVALEFEHYRGALPS